MKTVKTHPLSKTPRADHFEARVKDKGISLAPHADGRKNLVWVWYKDGDETYGAYVPFKQLHGALKNMLLPV